MKLRFAAVVSTALALAGTFLSLSAFAQLKVTDAWVRGTVAQQKSSGAFMSLTATEPLRLVEARSPVAALVEIHEMTMTDNVMRMRAVSGVDLPAGKTVDLSPGGFHVMLMDLRQQLKEGDSVPLTLVLEDRNRKQQTVEIKAAVRALTTPTAGKHNHKHEHKH